MFVFVFIFFCFSAFSENLGSAFFDPDYEKHLYNLYKKHHSQAISTSDWRQLISQKNVNVYLMQKGDNLWDVSKVLFGDPNYWPKLWSVNANLSNPHRVSVGHQLQVIMGTEGEAPRAVISSDTSQPAVNSFAQSSVDPVVSASSGDGIEVSSNNLMGKSDCVDDLSLIIDHKGVTKVYDRKYKCLSVREKIANRQTVDKAELDTYLASLEDPLDIRSTPKKDKAPVPKSLPYIMLVTGEGDLKLTVSMVSPAENINIVTNYQISEEDIDIVGRVNEILGGVPVPSGEIILNLDVPAQAGDSFSLINPIKSIRSQVRNPFVLEGGLGDEVVIQARVSIIGSVPGQGEGGFYFAQIDSMYNPINRNSRVIREDVSTFDLAGSFRKGSTKAQVVASASGQSGAMMMIHSFVYLNKGSSDGVNLGDVFDIQANSRVHGKNVRTSLGELLVVHVTPSYATAFVKNLNNPAYIGDYALSFDRLDQYISDEVVDDIIITEEDEGDFIEEGDLITEEKEDLGFGDTEDEEENDLLEEEDFVLEEGAEEEDLLEEEDFVLEEKLTDSSQSPNEDVEYPYEDEEAEWFAD